METSTFQQVWNLRLSLGPKKETMTNKMIILKESIASSKMIKYQDKYPLKIS